jgi:uncharacterized protein YlxW (UPF0749 family)
LPKFKFSLETLLRHREDTEQRERDELLRLNYKHQVELNHRHSLTLKFQETMHEISRRCEENTLDQELNWSYAYLNRLTHEIKECENRLKKLQSEVLAQQAVVIEAAKKRKALASINRNRKRNLLLRWKSRSKRKSMILW